MNIVKYWKRKHVRNAVPYFVVLTVPQQAARITVNGNTLPSCRH